MVWPWNWHTVISVYCWPKWAIWLYLRSRRWKNLGSTAKLSGKDMETWKEEVGANNSIHQKAQHILIFLQVGMLLLSFPPFSTGTRHKMKAIALSSDLLWFLVIVLPRDSQTFVYGGITGEVGNRTQIWLLFSNLLNHDHCGRDKSFTFLTSSCGNFETLWHLRLLSLE